MEQLIIQSLGILLRFQDVSRRYRNHHHPYHRHHHRHHHHHRRHHRHHHHHPHLGLPGRLLRVRANLRLLP